MAILDCTKIINSIKNEVRNKMKEDSSMAIVRVGSRPADVAYEKSVITKMSELSINCKSIVLDKDITNKEFIKQFTSINNDNFIKGILVLAPLPNHLDSDMIAELINPQKDLDGISKENILKVYEGHNEKYAPCTPHAVIKILDYLDIEYKGQNIVIVGAGNVVGKPLANILVNKQATVTICNEHTKNLEEHTKKADILVSATGVAHLINNNHVKEGAIVIDVGISLNKEGQIVGDVNTEVADKVKYLTPVPNGVGTITTYLLAERVVESTL